MITGSIVALVTPMHADGQVDWPALDRLVEFHIKHGTDALVAVGTTGESATLDTAEHCAVSMYHLPPPSCLSCALCLLFARTYPSSKIP